MAVSVSFGTPLPYRERASSPLVLTGLPLVVGSNYLTIASASAELNKIEIGSICYIHHSAGNYHYFEITGIVKAINNTKLNYASYQTVGAPPNTLSAGDLHIWQPASDIIQMTATLSGATVEVLNPSNIHIGTRSGHSDDARSNINATALYHADNKFNMLFEVIDPAASGFNTQLINQVFNKTTRAYEGFNTNSKNIAYNTEPPLIVEQIVPPVYHANAIYDAVIQFSHDVTFRLPSLVGSASDGYEIFFEFEGVNLGTSRKFYKKNNNTFPTPTATNPSGVTRTALNTAPTGWTEVGQTTSRGKIFMWRWWNLPSVDGAFNISLTEDAVLAKVVT